MMYSVGHIKIPISKFAKYWQLFRILLWNLQLFSCSIISRSCGWPPNGFCSSPQTLSWIFRGREWRTGREKRDKGMGEEERGRGREEREGKRRRWEGRGIKRGGRSPIFQIVQNALARIITRSSRSVPTSQLLSNLHWLPIHKRINFKVATLTYKVLTPHHSTTRLPS